MEHSVISATGATEAALDATVDGAAIASAADYLAKRIVPKRNTVPALGTIRMTPCDGGLRLSACDGETWASIVIAAAIYSPAAVAVDGEALCRAVAKAKGGEVRLTVERVSGKLSIVAGRARMNVATVHLDQVPDSRAFAPAWSVDLPTVGIKALNIVVPHIGEDSLMPGLYVGASCIGGKDHFAIGAAGQAMSLIACPIVEMNADVPSRMIGTVAADALLWAAKRVKGSTLSVAGDADGERLRFNVGDVELTTQSVEERDIWDDALGRLSAKSGGEPLLFPELDPHFDYAEIQSLEKRATGKLSWEDADSHVIIYDDGNPQWIGAIYRRALREKRGFSYTGYGEAKHYLMALADGDGLPGSDRVQSSADAAKAQWENKEPPREARSRGDSLYPIAPWALVNVDKPKLVERNGRVLGLTFSGEVRHRPWREKFADGQYFYHDRREEPLDGSFTVLMPADGPTLSVTGEITLEHDGKVYPLGVTGSGGVDISAETIAAMTTDIFDVIEFTGRDGNPTHVLQWQYARDDLSSFATVPAHGKVYGGELRETYTRTEIETALAGYSPCQTAVISDPAPQATVVATSDTITPDGPDTAICEDMAAIRPDDPATVESVDPSGDALTDIDAIIARIEALESAVATLSAVSDAAPIGGKHDGAAIVQLPVDDRARAIVAARAAIASERATNERASRLRIVRRYLAMRKARATLLERYANACDAIEIQRVRNEEWVAAIAAMIAERDEAKALLQAREAETMRLHRKRRNAVTSAFGLRKAARALPHAAKAANDWQRKHEAAQSELRKLKSSLVDPNCPERASDLVQLKGERDRARADLAQERQARAAIESRANLVADKMVDLAGRLAKAESALRRIEPHHQRFAA